MKDNLYVIVSNGNKLTFRSDIDVKDGDLITHGFIKYKVMVRHFVIDENEMLENVELYCDQADSNLSYNH